MGAAAVMVITAGGAFKWAASPFKAQIWEFEDTAASFSGGTGVIFITYRWGFHRTWRSWAWIWGVWSAFSGVGRLHCNSTETGWGIDITLHPDVATFAPVRTPRVSDNPVINASFRTISNHIYTMVQIRSTPSSEYTLNAYTYNKLDPFLVEVRKYKIFIEKSGYTDWYSWKLLPPPSMATDTTCFDAAFCSAFSLFTGTSS